MCFSISSSSKIALEAYEKWRLSNGDLAKTEDCYTKGLNSVSQSEQFGSYLRALMLCYSNRATTRISLGRMREALGDCLMAATIDPNFLKAQVRTTHLALRRRSDCQRFEKYYQEQKQAEALSASGLRAIRYAREMQGIRQVVALHNDNGW
ncbi:hypothetical protein L6452_02886 [Arctium lappa]|uniref:Uncharacterized protein n=1 Tax=Arctium lappa TaxID=4217 RepID=A0ACB9FKB1_ARCLA|nr:hypothetical protein L6452_02886 [Arctium lappa]